MRRAVIVIMDGMRRDLISTADTPHLCAIAEKVERFPDYSTIFPSCTRTSAASLATGCHPARHGLQGNAVALMENGRLVPRDVGDPAFFEHKRRITGRALAVPTLAERVRTKGGAIIFSNVSPGGAYAHDPDGFGHVYHRAGSFAPGRIPVPVDDHLDITPNPGGDRRMTERFVSEVLQARRPALAVLWLGEPDHTQHETPLGSPDHRAAMAQADANAASVWEAVGRLRAGGDDVLLLVGSDHGHQTVSGIVDIDGEMVAAGLKAHSQSTELMAISNGTAALIYLHPDHAALIPDLRAFLEAAHWAERVFGPEALHQVGQAAESGLVFGVSLRSGEECNAYGVPGWSLAAKPFQGKSDRMGCGQHGGLSRFDQAPFLFASGSEFVPGAVRTGAASIVDVAPTVLAHLGLPHGDLDGLPLQQPAGASGLLR